MKKTSDILKKFLLWAILLWCPYLFPQSESHSFRLGMGILNQGGDKRLSSEFRLLDSFGFHSLDNMFSVNYRSLEWMQKIRPIVTPDFYINFVHAVDTISPGERAYFQINIVPIYSFNATVSLGVSGFSIQGASYELSMASGTSPYSSMLTLTPLPK